MKREKILIAIIVALSLLCLSLIAYIAIGHFRNFDSHMDETCPRLSVADFEWSLTTISIDRSPVRRFTLIAPQDHWGEDEFAVLEAALDTFQPVEDDFIPPWYAYNAPAAWYTISDEPFIWRAFWWHQNNRPILPFDTIFILDVWSDDFDVAKFDQLQFGFSETYGAFAASRFGLFPCEGGIGYFRVCTDAFFALLSVIDLGEARFRLFP